MSDKPVKKRENEESTLEKNAKKLCRRKNIIEKNIDIDDFYNQPSTSRAESSSNINTRKNEGFLYPGELCTMLLHQLATTDDNNNKKYHQPLDQFNNSVFISKDTFFEEIEHDFNENYRSNVAVLDEDDDDDDEEEEATEHIRSQNNFCNSSGNISDEDSENDMTSFNSFFDMMASTDDLVSEITAAFDKWTTD